ncbi:hypothetical protein [Gloeobacter violaceus]|uniref:Glr2728 protein n=1 Tax=Gloeobacter violaceus (strain ATCC 29082 / PCC 7421) TaxID=251221 RepID=Q7NH09_GLOVI|nr:hypothetical protein [Gloeobacter violaceus]BAC90669.1 glr2728 [Gloeobacter violaceus PCC 7421]
MQTAASATPKTDAPWLEKARLEILEPRRRTMLAHPFVLAMQQGSARPEDAQRYFSGLMWHLLAFGAHVAHLFAKRPPEAALVLDGQSEDKDGDADLLARIVRAFGGPADLIEADPWSYRPHRVWIHHDALLRSAIYSTDLGWQVGTAALNVGIEALVPDMIEPLFKASVERYGVTPREAAWLESRAGEVERTHGENGFILLSHYVDAQDVALQKQCLFYIDALSYSMAGCLLESGLPE